ncbi:MAG: RnfH family protein [Usitatibacteraceae bacterium]
MRLASARPTAQHEIIVDVPAGTTLQEALQLLAREVSELCGTGTQGGQMVAGVWGKLRPAHYVLRDDDRIELYRPLKADPKQARRARVEKSPRRAS